MSITDFVSFTTILSNLATVTAVLVALLFGKKQLDDLKATRHGDIVKTVFEIWNTPDTYSAYIYTQKMEFKDWEDFKVSHPQGSDEWRLWMKTMNFFNTIGVLVKTKALDPEVAHMMLKALPRIWEKVQPIVIGYRSDFKSPHFSEEFEWLYNDSIKRQSN